MLLLAVFVCDLVAGQTNSVSLCVKIAKAVGKVVCRNAIFSTVFFAPTFPLLCQTY